jgi:hypothetical protein
MLSPATKLDGTTKWKPASIRQTQNDGQHSPALFLTANAADITPQKLTGVNPHSTHNLAPRSKHWASRQLQGVTANS